MRESSSTASSLKSRPARRRISPSSTTSKKKDGNGKKKPKDPRRKPKKREKFDGDVSELLEKLKLKYTAPQWKEREELVQSGKALAVDGFPYDKLFGNDKAENGKGKMQWV